MAHKHVMVHQALRLYVYKYKYTQERLYKKYRSTNTFCYLFGESVDKNAKRILYNKHII